MHTPPTLSFVCCASRLQVLEQRLLASPGLQEYPLAVHFHARSAAEGFNSAMAGLNGTPATWLVWVHQDVYLPDGWSTRFAEALQEAQQRFENLSVVGVYGVAGSGATARRAGHVLDRGTALREPTALPCLVDSLDELLVAVRADSGLRMDPDMGFDFYATDLVLQAQAQGQCAAVVDAYCEHWSDTPQFGDMPDVLLDRVGRNARRFEAKWIHRLPLTTPCFDIAAPGDVALALESAYRGR